MKLMTISVVIPAYADTGTPPILRALENMDYPQDKFEVIMGIGSCPAAQRNHAVKQAKGELLYFFNQDSQPKPDAFKKVVGILNAQTGVAGVGGPDLTPQGNNYTQQLFGYAMSSYFAHWRMRARYAQIGRERVSDETELILSNLAIRKDAFEQSGCFNEKLYPNEENELINRMVGKGDKLVYSPDVIIYRDRRKTLYDFARQFYGYGHGRMNQAFIERGAKNLLFFMPLILLIYTLALPFAGASWVMNIPLWTYVGCALIDALWLSYKHRKLLFFLLPPIYCIMHFSYGMGMTGSLWTRCTKQKRGNSVSGKAITSRVLKECR
ncbi:MAG: glycosyltransferase [Candidatus Omnitrophica bacterium]|nr:glycosyltransferase [Candidatus Omnitrophota bacterium]